MQFPGYKIFKQAIHPFEADHEIIENLLGGSFIVALSTVFAVLSKLKFENKSKTKQEMIQHIFSHLESGCVNYANIDCIIDILLILSKAENTQEMEQFLTDLLEEMFAFLLNPSQLYKPQKYNSLNLHKLYHYAIRAPKNHYYRLDDFSIFIDEPKLDANPTENLYLFFAKLYDIITTIESILLLLSNLCGMDEIKIAQFRNRFISICKLNFPKLPQLFQYTKTQLDGNIMGQVPNLIYPYEYRASCYEILELIERFPIEFGRGDLFNEALSIHMLLIDDLFKKSNSKLFPTIFTIPPLINHYKKIIKKIYYPYSSATFNLGAFISNNNILNMFYVPLPTAAFETFNHIINPKYEELAKFQ